MSQCTRIIPLWGSRARRSGVGVALPCPLHEPGGAARGEAAWPFPDGTGAPAVGAGTVQHGRTSYVESLKFKWIKTKTKNSGCTGLISSAP